MENHQKQPQRVLPVKELQSGFVMKRRKDNPRNLNCQAPRLHLLYDLPQHTKLHYRQWLEEQQAEEKKKQAKKQSKPERRKDERTTVNNKSHWAKKSLIGITGSDK